MRVKIEQACMWGEGKDRKRYKAGSVIEVPEDIQERNPWMQPTTDELTEAPDKKGEKVPGES